MSQRKTIVFNKERDVRRFVTNLDIYVRNALDDAMTDVAHAIEAKAIANLAKGYKGPTGEDGGALDTGRLQAGFRGIKDKPMRKVVGNNVSYAAHMEYGTGPAAGRPRYLPPYQEGTKLKSWSGRQGVADAGAVALQIYRRGTFPRRYLGRAFYTEKKRIPIKFFEHFSEGILDAAGLGIPMRKLK